MRIEKGWGFEEIWANTDMYCGKFLHFNAGGMSSMHFHKEKDETWYAQSGIFEITAINTHDASEIIFEFKAGETFRINPMTPHQVRCIQAGTIIEVSTKDTPEDNYRVRPGDSQC